MLSRRRRVAQKNLVPRNLVPRMIDALEMRRLLATFTGTAGPDLIELSYNGLEYIYSLNGGFAGSTTDSSIVLQGLGGGDDIRVRNLKTGVAGQLITVRGGAGDDIVRVARGNLIQDIDDGRIVIEELAGEGNDSLFVDDNGTAGAHAPLDVNNLSYTATLLGNTATIDFDQNTEVKQFNFSSQNDFARVFTVPVGMRLMLGDGTNTVIYGGTGQRIEGNPTPGYVEGGSGANLVKFDDTNAIVQVATRDYVITSTGLTNQTCVNIDDLELVLGYGDHHGNQVTILDDAGITNQIRVNSASEFGAHNDFQLGMESSPVDLDTFTADVILDIEVFGPSRYAIYEESPNVGADPFVLRTLANTTRIMKGSFETSFTSKGVGFDLDIDGGTANDSFVVDDVLPESSINIHGNGGDDTVSQTISGGRPAALDLIYRGEAFRFYGGEGDDRILLDDSGATLGGSPSDYKLGPFFSKQGSVEITTNVDEIVLNADAGDSTIRFVAESSFVDEQPERYQIRAGAGADTITNKLSTGAGGKLSRPVDVTILGQAGNDNLDFNDTLNTTNPGRSFEISSTQFRFGFGTATFDSTSESLNFTESDLSSSTVLRNKPAGMTVNVSLLGGDDQLTVGDGDLDSSGLLASGITLSAGTGNDSVVFDDRLDAAADGATSDYTFNNFSLAKGTPSILFSTFESVGLLASNHTVSGINVATIVNINSINGFVDNLSITGGPNRGCTVNVGNGTLGNIPLTNTFITCTAVNINDGSFTGPTTWNVNGSAVTRPTSNQTFNYQASALIINAGSGDDTIGVNSLGAGSSLNFNAANGVDRFTLGSGNVDADILGPVALIGGGGNNGLTINNSTDATAESQSLSNTAFVDGFTHTFSGLTSLTYNGGPGGTNLSLSNAVIPETINGGSGDDTFHLFNGSLINNFTANLILNAGGGTDTMNLLGQNDSASSRYDFPTVTQFRFGDVNTGKIITYSGLEQASLQTSSAGDTINVTQIPFALNLATGSGNDVVNISSIAGPVSTLPITVNTGPELMSFGGGDDLTVGGALVVIDQSDAVRNLSVNGTLRITSGAVLTRVPPFIDFLPLNLTGVIDLAGGALLWRGGGQIPDFRTMLTNGRNGGTWNGTSTSGAINSSLAASSAIVDTVGYGLGSQIAPASLGGFTIEDGDTLVRYTKDGDADLDQNVNFNDLVKLAQSYNLTAKSFSEGDFNYSTDGKVDFADLVVLAQQYNTSILTLPAFATPVQTKTPKGDKGPKGEILK